jgi:hypothetical protein
MYCVLHGEEALQRKLTQQPSRKKSTLYLAAPADMYCVLHGEEALQRKLTQQPSRKESTLYLAAPTDMYYVLHGEEALQRKLIQQQSRKKSTLYFSCSDRNVLCAAWRRGITKEFNPATEQERVQFVLAALTEMYCVLHGEEALFKIYAGPSQRERTSQPSQ